MEFFHCILPKFVAEIFILGLHLGTHNHFFNSGKWNQHKEKALEGKGGPEKVMILCDVTIFGIATYHPRLHLVSSTYFILILVHFDLLGFESLCITGQVLQK